MAKIQSGNWNDLPWMQNKKMDVDGKSTCSMKCFGMECDNLLYSMSEMKNGMPIDEHSHKHEQIVICLKGEVDYVVDGVPYRLTPGGWLNIPPYYAHYAHVYRSPEPCQVLEIMTPGNQVTSESYKQFLLETFGIDWSAGGTELPDLTGPKDPSKEI